MRPLSASPSTAVNPLALRAGRWLLLLRKAAVFAAVVLTLSVLCCAQTGRARAARAPAVRAPGALAKAYALVDQSSGRLIEGKNVSQHLPMASTTKMMTALIAVESGNLDRIVEVPAEAVNVEGSSMGLMSGERITMRSLVYGLMLESGNDAANAIAFTLGGSVEGFAALMNRRAQALGLADTHYENPSGLDAAGHYTSALDLARLGAAAMRNPQFAQIVGTRKILVPYNGTEGGRWLINHNRLLGSYAGEIGIKTGFTKKSGRCLVSCATRSGVTLVLSTLGDPDDWDDHRALLDGAFSTLSACGLPTVSPVTAQVVGGVADQVKTHFSGACSAALAKGELDRVREETDLPRFIYAPVAKGQKLGEIRYYVGGEVVARMDILSDGAVAAQRPPSGPFSGLAAFFRRLFGRKA